MDVSERGRDMLRKHFTVSKTIGFRDSKGKFHRLSRQQIQDLDDLYREGYAFDCDSDFDSLKTDAIGRKHRAGRVKVVWTYVKEPTFYILFRNHAPKKVELQTRTHGEETTYETWHAYKTLL